MTFDKSHVDKLRFAAYKKDTRAALPIVGYAIMKSYLLKNNRSHWRGAVIFYCTYVTCCFSEHKFYASDCTAA